MFYAISLRSAGDACSTLVSASGRLFHYISVVDGRRIYVFYRMEEKPIDFSISLMYC